MFFSSHLKFVTYLGSGKAIWAKTDPKKPIGGIWTSLTAVSLVESSQLRSNVNTKFHGGRKSWRVSQQSGPLCKRGYTVTSLFESESKSLSSGSIWSQSDKVLGLQSIRLKALGGFKCS